MPVRLSRQGICTYFAEPVLSLPDVGEDKVRGDLNTVVAVVGLFFTCCAHALKLELGHKITHARQCENCLA